LSLYGSSVFAEGPLEITPQFPEGRVLVVKSEQNNVTDAAGMRIVQVHIQEIQEEVLEARTDATRLRLTYLRQAMRTESPMGSMNFDSATDGAVASDPSFTLLGAIVGQSFDVVLEKDLTVREVTGADRIVQHIREVAPADMPVGALDQVAAAFNPEALAKMVSQKNEMYPARAVSTGDTWSNSVELELPGVGGMTSTSDFTLGDVSDGVATIDYLVSAVMEGNNTLLSSFNLSGTGRSHFDLEKGFFTDSKVEIKMTGEIQGMPMTVMSTVEMLQTLK